MKGKLFIVSGPSGSGKSTVTKLVKDRLNIPLSISATTRKPRNGEIDGKDYFFLTKETFEQKIKNDEDLKSKIQIIIERKNVIYKLDSNVELIEF